MTVIFADLAGFTTVAETLGGQATVSTLNRYMTRLTDVLVDQGAYVNKFLGDGVMAFWSAFADDPGQCTKACMAALRCQRAVVELNRDPAFGTVPEIAMRIGIATGRVVVGDCGAPPALNDYTVIGDSVNLAARLESANKQFGTGVLINGTTREQLAPDLPLRLRSLGKIVVVGQSAAVPIFEVLGPDAPEELIELSDRAVLAYASGAFDECRAALDALEARHGQAKLAKLYREAIDVVDDTFDGALHLLNK
jgi:adenylate cyclase